MENIWAPWRMEYISSAKDEAETDCIFCTRLNRNEDEKDLILYRGKQAFIIMNRYPYNNGHLMIVPHSHTGDLLELSAEENSELMALLQLANKALSKVMGPHGFNIGMNIGRVAGAGVADHLHYHILPRWNGDTNFMPVIANVKVVSESLEDSYRKLKSAILEIIESEK